MAKKVARNQGVLSVIIEGTGLGGNLHELRIKSKASGLAEEPRTSNNRRIQKIQCMRANFRSHPFVQMNPDFSAATLFSNCPPPSSSAEHGVSPWLEKSGIFHASESYSSHFF